MNWIRSYTPSQFRGDLSAGLTVGVMLVPQAMAYALLAGMPPVYGLYASLVPLAVYTFLGTSRHLAAGIMAIDCLLVISVASAFAEPGTPAYIDTVLSLALLSGLIQLALGVARFGFLVALLSRPVVAGFASAAALSIGFSQMPGLLGTGGAASGSLSSLFELLRTLPQTLHPVSALIGLVAVLVIMLIRRHWRKVPGALIVVVVGILLVWALGLDANGVAIVGAVPAGFPQWRVPTLTLELTGRLFPAALTLALVQFTTVISLGKVFASRNGYRIDANRELLAVGAMNAIGSTLGSIPVSGSFSRSAVNESAGAATPAANLITAALIAVTLLLLTPAFFYLPIPVFSAIIMVAAFTMVDVPEIRLLLKTKRMDGLIALVTFATTLIIGIQEGILTGIAASITAVMFRITRPEIVELGHLPETRLFRELGRNPEAVSINGIYIVRFEASFSFVNADFIRDHIERHLLENPGTRALLIDSTSINDLDTTAADVLADLCEALDKRGVRLVFSGVKGRVGDVLAAAGLQERIGPNNFFLSPHRAVQSILADWGRQHEYRHAPGTQEE
ncbi:MAG: sulfate permease [Rhodothermales bacterium]|nr:sulfate permease [Rhodothermales bacterium]MBO6778839.1 sulfate permease [Rhodothermales bacterium]